MRRKIHLSPNTVFFDNKRFWMASARWVSWLTLLSMLLAAIVTPSQVVQAGDASGAFSRHAPWQSTSVSSWWSKLSASNVDLLESPATNDDFDDAVQIVDLPFTETVTTTLTTVAADDPIIGCGAALPATQSNTVWYRYTPAQDMRLVVDTFGSDYDTVVAVWTGSRGTLQAENCNNDIFTYRNESGLAIWATAGITYYFEVAQYGGSGGGALMLRVRHWTEEPATILASAPEESVQLDGGSESVSISADGQYVAFASWATNLIPADTNDRDDIFVKDLATGQLERISVASDGTQTNNTSSEPFISGDGRYVIFTSYATNLILGDTNNQPDVFLHDRQTHQTTRVSVSSAGVQANNSSFGAGISPDGRYVLFSSSATNLVLGDTNAKQDVFLHDRQTSQTTRVSVATGGVQADNYSTGMSFSSDGRYIAFLSSATNLVANDTNAKVDLFVYDRQTGVTTRESVSSAGVQADNDIWKAAISSGDGRWVVFESTATNLVADDTNGRSDVFFRDRFTGQTSRASLNLDGSQLTGTNSWNPDISADGRYIVYGTHLPTPDEISAIEYHEGIVLYDQLTGERYLASTAEDGGRGNNYNYLGGFALTDDGHYLVFSSDNNGLVPNDFNGDYDVFVHDVWYPGFPVNDDLSGAPSLKVLPFRGWMNTQTATTASDDPAVSCADDTLVAQSHSVWFRYTASVSETLAIHTLRSNYDTVLAVWTGERGALVEQACLDDASGYGVQSAVRLDVLAGQTYWIEVTAYGDDVGGVLGLRVQSVVGGGTEIISGSGTANGHSDITALSADGRYTAFTSGATDLVLNDTNNAWDVFVYDRLTDAIQRVSVDSSGVQANAGSDDPVLSASGRYVAFSSEATNLVAVDTNAQRDIFVYDRSTNQAEMVSIASDGAQANNRSSAPAISADGRYIVFESTATNLVANDTNGQQDIFVHDRLTGETTRINVSNTGEQGNGWSNEASLSADGRYVVFESSATNLTPNDTNDGNDIFLVDRSSGQIRRVNLNSAGEQADSYSDSPSISANGRYVVFFSDATNLVAGYADSYDDAFVVDLLSGAIERVSISNLGTQGNGNAWGPASISNNGRYVTFYSSAWNLTPDNGNDDWNTEDQIYVYDRLTLYTWRASVSTFGDRGNEYSYEPVISFDGRFVSFSSYASNLTPGDTNNKDDVFLYRLTDTANDIPSHDDIDHATEVDVLPYLDFAGTIEATSAADDPLPSCGEATPAAQSNSVWYRYTPDVSGKVAVDTLLGSDYDTVIAVWSGERGALNELGCARSAAHDGTTELTVLLTGGQTYWIEAAHAGAPGGGLLALRIQPAPGGPAVALFLQVPAEVSPVIPFSAVVAAYDADGNLATPYAGKVHFESSDPHGIMPADHTFSPGTGQYTFGSGFSLESTGVNTITVVDVNNPLLSATAVVTVGHILRVPDGQGIFVDRISYALSSTVPVGATSLPYTPPLRVVAGDELLVLTLSGANLGAYETVTVTSVISDEILLAAPLVNSYDGMTDKVLVQRVPQYPDVIVESGGKITVNSWNGRTGGVLFFRAESLEVQAGGLIDAMYVGYRPGEGPGAGAVKQGGGYGGAGGGTNGGQAYGSVTEPFLPGSPGGSNYTYAGHGGGIIHIVVSDTLQVDGQVSASGDYSAYLGGGGAGGSIWLQANSFAGNGLVSANGGGANYGAGSGGRVAVYSAVNTFTGSLQAASNNSSLVGSPGTIYLHNTQSGFRHLRVDNLGYSGGKAVVTDPAITHWVFDRIELLGNGNLIFSDLGDTFEITDSNQAGDATSQIYVLQDIALQVNQMRYFGLNIPVGVTVTFPGDFSLLGARLDNAGVLQGISNLTLAAANGKNSFLRLETSGHTAGQSAGTYFFGQVIIQANQTLELPGDPASGSGVTIWADAMTAAGLVTADGLGYTPSQNGPGAATADTGGGGHGGAGGGVGGGSTYGSTSYPETLGSAGLIANASGSGGGAIHLVITNTLDIPGAGTITANGFPCEELTYGGGAGGSIWISASAVTGEGKVRARGGNTFSYGGAGGGGGGRIAVHASSIMPSVSFEVNGGTGSQAGAGGSLFLNTLDTDLSSVAVNPASLSTLSTALISVTLRSVNGIPMPDQLVSLNLLSGARVKVNGEWLNTSATLPIGLTNQDGHLVVQLTAQAIGERRIQVYGGQLPVSQLAVITWTPGPLDEDQSLLQARPYQTVADGHSPISVTVTARDGYSNPIANANVILAASGNAVITQPLTTTDAFGQAVGWVTDAVPQAVVVQAQVDGFLLSREITVTFRGADAAGVLAAPPETPPGEIYNYQLDIRNLGSLPADNVVVTHTLPTDVSFVYHTAYVAPTQKDNQLIWSFGTLQPGTSLPFLVYVRAPLTATLGSDLVSTLIVSTSGLDDTPANNLAQASTHVVSGYQYVASLDPASQEISLGQPGIYKVLVQNTGLLPDTYRFAVQGLEQATQVTFALTQTTLAPGGMAENLLGVRFDNCGVQGTWPFTVTVVSDVMQTQQVFTGTLTLVQDPVIENMLPANHSKLSTRDVVMSWNTAVSTTGSVSIYPVLHPELETTLLAQEGVFHYVFSSNLERNTTYAWKAKANSLCGTTESALSYFTVDNGVSFRQRTFEFDIAHDYDQKMDVEVINWDTQPHTITVQIENSYDDLIVNFTGPGSIDEALMLRPGERRKLTLALHAQDAARREYDLKALLVSDPDSNDPITDSAIIHVVVRSQADYSLTQIGVDPLTGALIYKITNHGLTLTDLQVNASDPATGGPARVFINPNVLHAQLGSDESLTFQVSPIYGEQDVVGGQAPSMASTEGDSSTASILFDLFANAGGNTQGDSDNEITCEEGKQVYPVTFRNVYAKFPAHAWYCTNKPNISVPFNLPYFVQPGNVIGLALEALFRPWGGARPHTAVIGLNGTTLDVLSDTVPNGFYSWTASPNTLHTSWSGNVVQQTATIHSYHMNGGHYVVATDFGLGVAFDEITVYICASSYAEAVEIAKQLYGFVPLPEIVDVSILAPHDGDDLRPTEGGWIDLLAYVEDDQATYYNYYDVEARMEYLDQFWTPEETIRLFDDGEADHDDYNNNDRYFGNRWTPLYPGLVRMTVTATAPQGLKSVKVITFRVRLLPDLTVTKVFLEKVSLLNQVARVRAVIMNLGGKITGPVIVQFRYYEVDENGEPVGAPVYISNITILENILGAQSLERGESVEVEDTQFTPQQTMVYYVEVVVDP